VKVVRLKMTGRAFPLQYEGELDDGRWIYFRERHSFWWLGIGPSLAAAVRNEIARGELRRFGEIEPEVAENLIRAIVATEPGRLSNEEVMSP